MAPGSTLGARASTLYPLLSTPAERRELPNCAKSRTAQSPKVREVPKCAKSQNAADGGRCNLRSRRSERSAVQRPMGFRALWDFALYGTSRSMGPRALWDLALYGTLSHPA